MQVQQEGWQTVPGTKWIWTASLALATFAFLRAGRLLREWRKEGALLAAFCLATSLGVSAHVGHVSWGALAVPFLGLGLLASLWRHLE